MADPGLNQLLQWGIENSANPTSTGQTQPGEGQQQQQRDPSRGLNADVLAQLLGGPSDADRMRMAMTAILAPLEQVNLEDKMIAWDNFEQLVEVIDNANNMEGLGLWMPLVEQLDNEMADMRRMAAWCLSTAVQNNVKSQERLLAIGAIPKLVKLAIEDSEQKVRKKAVSALSSEVRNYQPAMTELEKCLPDDLASEGRKADAADMEAVDEVIQRLRDQAARA